MARKYLTHAGITLNGSAPFDPQVRNSRVFRRTLLLGRLGLGDSYVDGDWDCDALDVFVDKVVRGRLDYNVNPLLEHIFTAWSWLVNLQSVRRAFHVAEHHYDLGNDLYEHMLGESMAYSSAYFKDGATNLTDAQFAKFDAVCKKLGLRSGMKILEIGCGWGTFARFAAKNYGVSVVGVTVSKEQLAYAEKVCEGLPVTFFFGDYRTLPDSYNGTFDRAVSIEMIEAVGPKNFRAYMQVAHRALTEEGSFLVQAIMGTGDVDTWISTRIFPNGILPSFKQLSVAVEGLFHISHVENFGADYDRTLMLWDERFRAAWSTLKAAQNAAGVARYDERFYRMWRYYLLICAGAFRSRRIDVSHLIFSKPAIG